MNQFTNFNKLMEMHLLLSKELIVPNRRKTKFHIKKTINESNNVSRKNYLSSNWKK